MPFWDGWFSGSDTGAKAKGARPAKAKKPKKAKKAKVQKVDIDKRFTKNGQMGQGSMSKVFRATDRESGRSVCLKVLDKVKMDALLKRFVNMDRPDEGVVAMKLKHPNIVKTFEHGITRKNEQYLVMELVEGSGLSFYAGSPNAAPEPRVIGFLVQLGEALKYVHDAGFIHRDICPRNAMVGMDGVLKLIDFGLAVPNTKDFRRPGNRTGTAEFMAPELIRRAATDERIDVYSYGVSLFNILTGAMPWEQAESLQAMLQQINTAPRDPQEMNPHLSDELAAVIRKAMAKDPRDRYESMAAVLEDLRPSAPAPTP